MQRQDLGCSAGGCTLYRGVVSHFQGLMMRQDAVVSTVTSILNPHFC